MRPPDPPDPLGDFIVPTSPPPPAPRSSTTLAPLHKPPPDPESLKHDLRIDGHLEGGLAATREIDDAQERVQGGLLSPASPSPPAGVGASALLVVAGNQAASNARRPSVDPGKSEGRCCGAADVPCGCSGRGPVAVKHLRARSHQCQLAEACAIATAHQRSSSASTPAGFDAGNASQRSPQMVEQESSQEQEDNQLPRSPTQIDPELQAQAWAILPDLVKDLNSQKSLNQQQRTATVEEGKAIKPRQDEARKQLNGSAMNPQEDMVLQDELLRSRIPARQKGKSVHTEEGIHGGQATSCHAQDTSTESHLPDSAATRSTHLKLHNSDSLMDEDGWEPAKLYYRKKPEAKSKIIQSSYRPHDKPTGSAFFKSRLEGRCFNCFSPNHLAHTCHRLPRCWKCYRSGHRAKDCYRSHALNSRPEQHNRERHL